MRTQRDKIAAEETEVMIGLLTRHLRRNPLLQQVVAITNAKVPIVKFVWRDGELEGDISLYNTLVSVTGRHPVLRHAAIVNSQLC